MAVYKTTDGRWVASYDGNKKYFSSQSAAMSGYSKMKSGSGSGSSGGSSSNLSVAQQLQNIKDQALNIQSEIYKGVDAGTIKSSSNKSGQEQLNDVVTQQKRFGLVDASYNAPTIASAVTTLDSVQTPTTPPPTGDKTYGMAAVTGRTEYEQQRLDQIEKEKEDRLRRLEQKDKENKSLWNQMMGDSVSPGEARDQAMEETGIDVQEHFATIKAMSKEVETLDNEYANLVAQRDQEIAGTRDMMASMTFVDNRIAQIERNAAPKLNLISARINAKAALMEALSGNFANAQTYIRQAVEDATADAKWRADRYQELYNLNSDNFEMVESVYADAYKEKMDLEQRMYEEFRADKETVGQLIISNPQAGIDINDTLDEAFRKIGINPMSPERRLLEAQIANEWDNTGNGDTTESVSNFTNTMQQAIDAGATPEQAAQEAAMASELLGVPVSQDTLAEWTRQARAMKPTPVAPTMNREQQILSQGATISSGGGSYTTKETKPDITLTGLWNSLWGD